MLGLVTALALSACTHGQTVPEVNVYKEIPFIDAPEGVSVSTLHHKEKLYPADEWREISPLLLCVDDKGWAEIKKGWLAACRFAASRGEDCNAKLKSASDVVMALDEIARRIYPAVKAIP